MRAPLLGMYHRQHTVVFMIDDMAVQHPMAGIMKLDRHINKFPRRNHHGIFPGFTFRRLTVYGYNLKMASVQMYGMLGYVMLYSAYVIVCKTENIHLVSVTFKNINVAVNAISLFREFFAI